MDNLFVEIVAPNRRAFQGQAQGLRAPGAEGSFEILKDHAPMIATIEVGPIDGGAPRPSRAALHEPALLRGRAVYRHAGRLR